MKRFILLAAMLWSSGANAENVFVLQRQYGSLIWILYLTKCELQIADAPYMRHFEMKNFQVKTDGCWGETLDGSLKIIEVMHQPYGPYGPDHQNIPAHNFVDVEMFYKSMFMPATIDKSGNVKWGKPTQEWGLYAHEPKPPIPPTQAEIDAADAAKEKEDQATQERIKEYEDHQREFDKLPVGPPPPPAWVRFLGGQ